MWKSLFSPDSFVSIYLQHFLKKVNGYENNNKRFLQLFLIPCGFAPGKTPWKSFFSMFGSERIYKIAWGKKLQLITFIDMIQTSSLVILLRVSFVGVPHIFRTFVIWSISEEKIFLKVSRSNLFIRSSPGNNGLPVSNSAIIQPTDQISTTKFKICKYHLGLPWITSLCIVHPV